MYSQITWIKQDNCPETAQLCFVHLHISHFVNKLSKNPAVWENV